MTDEQAAALENARAALSKLIHLYPDVLTSTKFVASAMVELLELQCSYHMIKDNIEKTHNNS